MMRSLYAAISGLRNHQIKMDVIGNNIANVNTAGFKSGNVNFQDMLSQTLSGASSGNGTTGGTNPMQVGLGVSTADISTNFTDGSTQSTGVQSDLAITGQGFFILGDPLNQVYSRAGHFTFDASGNLVVPGTGMKVLGWQGDSSGVVNTTGTVSGIQIPVGTSMPAKVSTSITIIGNLNASAASGTSQPVSLPVYDTLGNSYKLTGTITKAALPATNEWTFTPDTNIYGADGKTVVGKTNGAASTLKFDPTTGAFDPSSTIASIQITPDAAGPYAGAGVFSVMPTASTMTQYGSDMTAQISTTDGYTAGTLTSGGGITIASDGTIVGTFTNGKKMNLAKIAIATFNNPGGLMKEGDSLYAASSNSGQPQIGTAGTGGRGTLTPGSLEMSNVDLAQEFSNMIVTQRGFQANSKVITTTDTMLEELVNLKR